MRVWVYSRGLPYLPIPPGGFNLTEDGATVDDWLNFSGLKVGHIHLYPSFLTIKWRLLYIIGEYDYS
jgi:hypothetical protein